MKNVLVMNAGSSSLKFQVMDMQEDTVLAKGLCERIGMEGAVLTYRRQGAQPLVVTQQMQNHHAAIALVLGMLVDKQHGVLHSMEDIIAVGHRVPHGGEDFDRSVRIDDAVMQLIRDNAQLAPLHSPPIIQGIEACQSLMPHTPMVAAFDTAFHQTMPEKAYLYALPYEDYETLRIRRYGFHGTSHKYVAQRAAALLGRPLEELKIITCHLGNGSSIAAISGGKSVDTTMGFTPLEGVPMGTRSGTFDPAVVMYLMEKKGYSLDQINTHLQKKSGVYGISGVSSDFRDLHSAAQAGNHRAQLALDVFCYAVRKYIGAYAAAMDGVDCILFTGGIGENDALVRRACVENLEFMGVEFDTAANAAPAGPEACISTSGSRVAVLVVPTNEEWMIAKDAARIVELL